MGMCCVRCGSYQPPVSTAGLCQSCAQGYTTNPVLPAQLPCPSCAEKDAEIRELKENHQIVLASISVVSLANTEESAKNCRLPRSNPYWTVTHDDVCTAIDREMALRSRIAPLERIKERAINGTCGCMICKALRGEG